MQRKSVVWKLNIIFSSKRRIMETFIFNIEITFSVIAVSLLVCFLSFKSNSVWIFSILQHFPSLTLIALKWVQDLNCGIGAVNIEFHYARNLNLSSVSLLVYLIKMLSSKLNWRDNAEWNISYHHQVHKHRTKVNNCHPQINILVPKELLFINI